MDTINPVVRRSTPNTDARPSPSSTNGVTNDRRSSPASTSVRLASTAQALPKT